LRVNIPPEAAEQVIDPEVTGMMLLGLAHDRQRFVLVFVSEHGARKPGEDDRRLGRSCRCMGQRVEFLRVIFDERFPECVPPIIVVRSVQHVP